MTKNITTFARIIAIFLVPLCGSGTLSGMKLYQVMRGKRAQPLARIITAMANVTNSNDEVKLIILEEATTAKTTPSDLINTTIFYGEKNTTQTLASSSLIFQAIEHWPINRLELLLDLRANMELVDCTDRLPFQHAMFLKKNDHARLLFNRGCRIDRLDLPLHVMAYYHAAEGIKAHYHLLKDSAQRFDPFGMKPIHAAIMRAMETADQRGNITEEAAQTIQQLLTNDASTITHRTQQGKTPLHLAAEGKNIELIQLLLSYGGDLHAPLKTHIKNEEVTIAITPRMIILRNQCLKADEIDWLETESFVYQAEQQKQNTDLEEHQEMLRMRSMQKLAHAGLFEQEQQLLHEKTKQLCLEENKKECHPLCAAAIFNAPSIVNFQLNLGVNLRKTLYDDMNALYLAMLHNANEALKTILINPITKRPRSFTYTLVNEKITDPSGKEWTPLMFAITFGNETAVKLLISYGAEYYGENSACDNVSPRQYAEQHLNAITPDDPTYQARLRIVKLLRLIKADTSMDHLVGFDALAITRNRSV